MAALEEGVEICSEVERWSKAKGGRRLHDDERHSARKVQFLPSSLTTGASLNEKELPEFNPPFTEQLHSCVV
jgi:hypothetical protein